jgi:predicted RNA binding protein YcfA (HicA-like mRNA interferase family)
MSEQKLQKSLRAHGFELVRQKRHRVYKNPAGHTFVTSSTPSDRCWSTNALADLARLCGPAETDSRPLRARRRHGRLDSEPRRDAVPIDSSLEKAEAQPTPAPATPALSRADRQRLKRWEKHENQRGAKDARRLAKLRDLAHRAHESLERRSAERSILIVMLTVETHRRVRQLGFQDVALSVADVAKDGWDAGRSIYIRVGGRFIDIIEGVLREGQTWVDAGGATVEVWADIHPGDFAELAEEPMYLGPDDSANPFNLNLELKIPDGRTMELALFRALLSYEEGVPPAIVVNGKLLYGMVKRVGETIQCRAMRLTGGDTDEIVGAVYADDSDWPGLLENAREGFMDGWKCDESYIEWLKSEIAKREDDTKAA